MSDVDFDEYYRNAHRTEFDDPSYWWHPRNPIDVAYRFQLERAILRALNGRVTVEEADVLDVGCGSGRILRYLVEIGADPTRVHGVDVIPERVGRARAMNSSLDVQLINAAEGLPFPDASFNLVTQFVMLSSVLDHGARQRIASEMVRVLRPDGYLVTYEIRRPQPGRIPDGIPQAQVPSLFAGMQWVDDRRLHNRALAKLARWPLVAELVERIPGVPKTNYVMVGRRVG